MTNLDKAVRVFERVAALGEAELEDEATLFKSDVDSDLSMLVSFEEVGDSIVLSENGEVTSEFNSLSRDFEEDFLDYVLDVLNF